MGKKDPVEGTGEATPYFNTNHSCKITIIFKFYIRILNSSSHPCSYLTYILHAAESLLKSLSVFSQLRNSPHFMEPEGSLPCSKVPATCPYPEPPRSRPYPHILLPEDLSKYYPPIYAWVSQVASFPQVSPPKHCTHLSSPPYALHAPPISFFSILSSEQYWARSTYEAPHYVVFSTPLLLRPS